MGWIRSLFKKPLSSDEIEELIRTLESLQGDIKPLVKLNRIILEHEKRGRKIRPEDKQELLAALERIKIKEMEAEAARVLQEAKRIEQVKEERRRQEEAVNQLFKAAEASNSPEPLLKLSDYLNNKIWEAIGNLPAARKIVPPAIYEEIILRIIWHEKGLPHSARKRIALYLLKAFCDYYNIMDIPLNLEPRLLNERYLYSLCQQLLKRDIPNEAKERIKSVLDNVPYDGRQKIPLVFIGTVYLDEAGNWSKDLSPEQQTQLMNLMKPIW